MDKTYNVKITSQAEEQIQEIMHYISNDLKASWLMKNHGIQTKCIRHKINFLPLIYFLHLFILYARKL